MYHCMLIDFGFYRSQFQKIKDWEESEVLR